MRNSETTDPGDEIRPFLGKAKELPERTQQIVRQVLSEAKEVEGMGSDAVEDCPVCGAKIDGSLVAVSVPGRRSELMPKKLVHMVLAHDFWHPSMQILVNGSTKKVRRPTDPDLDDSVDSSPSGTDSSDEVIERGEDDELPFSGLSEDLVDQVEIDVSPILSARDRSRRGRPPEGPPDGEPPVRGRRRPGLPGQDKEGSAVDGRRSAVPRSGSTDHRSPTLEPRPEGSRGERSRTDQSTALVRYGATNEEANQIQKAYGIPMALAGGICDIARSVGAHPFDLANLIHFESRFDPAARGPSDVGATGLIQFTPRASRDLGITTDALRRMTAEQQLPYVRKYLDRIRAGQLLDTPQKLYMAVFYPAAMTWPEGQEFPADMIEKNTYRVGEEVVSIRTPADYGRRVELRSALQPSFPTAVPTSGNPLEGVFSWISNLFSSLTGTGEGPTNGSPPNGSSSDPTTHRPPSTSSASWVAGPGVVAILVDEAGREWMTGQVPAGKYRLLVQGKPPSQIQILAGRNYRASSIGRMFGDVVDGG